VHFACHTHSEPPVMLNYAGEYCNACQAAVTVIRSCDALEVLPGVANNE